MIESVVVGHLRLCRHHVATRPELAVIAGVLSGLVLSRVAEMKRQSGKWLPESGVGASVARPRVLCGPHDFAVGKPVDGGWAIESLEEAAEPPAGGFAPDAKNPQTNQPFAPAGWPRFYLAVRGRHVGTRRSINAQFRTWDVHLRAGGGGRTLSSERHRADRRRVLL